MRDQLRLVFTSFLNVDDSDDSTLSPLSSKVGTADNGGDTVQEEIPSELERKGFHYLNDVQVHCLTFVYCLFISRISLCF